MLLDELKLLGQPHKIFEDNVGVTFISANFQLRKLTNDLKHRVSREFNEDRNGSQQDVVHRTYVDHKIVIIDTKNLDTNAL